MCQAQCGAEGGALVPGSGLCQCAVVVDVDSVCDAACRASQVKTTLLPAGTIKLTDPVTGAESVFDPTADPGYGGSATCSQAGACPVTSVGRAADGSFTADYSTNARLLAQGGIESSVDKTSTRLRRRRALQEQGRSLQAAQASDAAIANPVICVNVGAVILFDVDAVEGRYPVYVKDSILNTNQDFDRAPFDELATLVGAGV